MQLLADQARRALERPQSEEVLSLELTQPTASETSEKVRSSAMIHCDPPDAWRAIAVAEPSSLCSGEPIEAENDEGMVLLCERIVMRPSCGDSSSGDIKPSIGVSLCCKRTVTGLEAT